MLRLRNALTVLSLPVEVPAVSTDDSEKWRKLPAPRAAGQSASESAFGVPAYRVSRRDAQRD